MRLSRRLLLLSALGAGLPAGVLARDAGTPEHRDLRYKASTSASYDDVIFDVKFAITQENYRITGGNQIGAAINARHGISLPHSEVIHLCNLEYARKFMEAAPDFLLHMPCKLVVYEDGEQVSVEARLLPEDDARVTALTAEVNAILRRIVDAATES